MANTCNSVTQMMKPWLREFSLGRRKTAPKWQNGRSQDIPQRVKVEEDEAAGLQCAQWTKTLVHTVDKYSFAHSFDQ